MTHSAPARVYGTSPFAGGCSATTVRCPSGYNLRHLTPECCVVKVTELIAFSAEHLTALGIKWWGDYGTALAAVKCGHQYPKDKDGDLGAVQPSDEQIRAFGAAAVKAGYSFEHKVPRKSGPYGGGNSLKLRYSATNHNNVDVFLWHQHVDGKCTDPLCEDKARKPLPGSMVGPLRQGVTWHRRAYISVDQEKGKEIPDAMLFPLAEATYEGMNLPVPAGVFAPGPTRVPQEWSSRLPGLDERVRSGGSWFLEHRYGPWWQDRDACSDGRRR